MSYHSDDPTNDFPFLAGGGKMAKLIRHHNWSATPLGAIEDWPDALKAALRIVLRTPIPIVTLWGQSGTMIYNDGYIDFARSRHPEQLGLPVREGWPEVVDFNDNVMNICLAGGSLSYQNQEFTLYRNEVAQQVWMNLDYSPIVDEAGHPVGVMAIVIETTAQVLADRRNAAEHDRLQRMFEQAPAFMAIVRGDKHVFEMVNPGYLRLVGHRDILGKAVSEALPEVASQGFVDMLDTAFRSGEAVTGAALPVLLEREHGQTQEERFVDFVYQPIRNEENAVTHIFVQGSDVTERVIGLRRQKLLMHELSHRVKNSLAIVNAIATRTLRGAASLDEARVNLNARIVALSRAHNILIRRTGDGAEIGEVVRAAVQSHDDGRSTFQIEGPELNLTAGAALAISLALHELTTNATKFGALSLDTGQVSISWTIARQKDGPVLQFIWEESGGPHVSLPTRQGFGSTLIEKAIATETGGTARIDYRPTGVCFTLEAPQASVQTL